MYETNMCNFMIDFYYRKNLNFFSFWMPETDYFTDEVLKNRSLCGW